MPDETQSGRSSAVYNIEFAVPEMVKSIRSINSKLVRDLYFVFGLIAIFIISPFAADTNKINFFGQFFYISFLTLSIKLFALFMICLSIYSNLIKLYLLYRQLDDEVKIYFSAPQGENDDMITKSSHMTPFIISDTFFADVFFCGPKRHPSLLRFLSLCFSVFLLFTITTIIFSISYNAEYTIYCLPLTIHNVCMLKFDTIIINYAAILVFLFIIAYLFKTSFIDRSAFLEEAGKIRQIFEKFITVLSQLDDLTRVQWVGNLGDKIFEYVGVIKNSFYKIPLGNIQDDPQYLDKIKDYIKTIYEIDKYINNTINEREYLDLTDELKNTARLRIKSFNLTKNHMFSTINEINRLFEDLEKKYSVYDYCILHNKYVLKVTSITGYLQFLSYVITYNRKKL